MKLFLQSVTEPKRRFEILEYDPDTKIGLLQSVPNPEFPAFNQSLDKDFVKSIGYRVERSEV